MIEIIAGILILDVILRGYKAIKRERRLKTYDIDDVFGESSSETLIEVIEVIGPEALEAVLLDFETSEEIDYYVIRGMSSIVQKPNIVHTVIIEYEKKAKDD